MAESLFFNKRVKYITEDPNRLWIWDKVTFMDEQRRTWLPIILQTENNQQVLLRQQRIQVGDPLSPSQLTSCPLPLMWQQDSERKYRANDDSIWRIVYHIEFCGTEDILLEKMPSQE